jgi:hypothetical protein
MVVLSQKWVYRACWLGRWTESRVWKHWELHPSVCLLPSRSKVPEAWPSESYDFHSCHPLTERWTAGWGSTETHLWELHPSMFYCHAGLRAQVEILWIQRLAQILPPQQEVNCWMMSVSIKAEWTGPSVLQYPMQNSLLCVFPYPTLMYSRVTPQLGHHWIQTWELPHPQTTKHLQPAVAPNTQRSDASIVKAVQKPEGRVVSHTSSLAGVRLSLLLLGYYWT